MVIIYDFLRQTKNIRLQSPTLRFKEWPKSLAATEKVCPCSLSCYYVHILLTGVMLLITKASF